MPTTVTDASVSTSVEGSRSFIPGNDALSQAEGLPEDLTQSNPDPDSFSDSYTHISTSPDETPVSLLSTETLEGGGFSQEEERLTEEGTLHLQSGEELQRDSLVKRAGMNNQTQFVTVFGHYRLARGSLYYFLSILEIKP